MVEFASHIEAVARKLLGEPNPEYSTKRELRFGNRGSLSVEIAGAKQGTWYDHEAETGGGVLDLIKRETALANGDAVEWLRGIGVEVEAKLEIKAAPRIVATYDYTDKAGKLLFQVVRYEPKDFRQRRPDPSGKGGWIWSVKDAEMVPFNLSAVMGAETVYVVEGEKDVLNLRRLGLVATTNPGGAKKWKSHFAQYFAGKQVVVIPDNDDTGRSHAEQVVRNLTGVAASVVSLDLPNLPIKGDVSNWIESGGTAEDLKWPVEGAEPAEPMPNPAELAAFLSAKNWLGRTLEPPEPLLGEVVTNTTRMFLGGPTGLGKTHVGFGMAAGMATGEGFLHWKASRASRVLYLDGEMSRDLVQERLADLQRRFGGVELLNLFVLCAEDREEIAAMCPDLGEMGPLNTPEGQAFVLSLIDRIGGVDVVFLDNRMSLLSGDMKEEQPWTDTMALVKELTRRRIAQIWIDHTGHDTGRIYGTKTKEWQFDTVALMEKADRPGADIAFSLKFEKARRRKPSNRANFEMITATLTNDEWNVEGATGVRAKGKVSAMAAAFHEALVNALAITRTPGVVTRDLWYAECVRLGLLDAIRTDDSRDAADRKRSKLRKYIAELKAGGWVGVNGESVSSLVVKPAEPLPNLAEPPMWGGNPSKQTAEPSRQGAEPASNHGVSNPIRGAEPLPNPLPNLAEPAEPAPANGEVKPARNGSFPGPNPAQSAEPAEPQKKGAEPLPNLSVPNLPNPAEPLPNPCRTFAEPSGGIVPNLPNPVSIDGFGGTAVRRPVRQSPADAKTMDADEPEKAEEVARLHRIIDSAEMLAGLAERLERCRPVAPDVSGAKLLERVEP